jgi:membrane protein
MATAQALRDRGGDARCLWNFGGLTLWQLARNVAHETQRNELFERAAGLAFDFLLALFSMLFILLAVFDLFASLSVQLRTDLLAYFADFLPKLAFQLLRSTTEELATKKDAEKMTIGIAVSLWLVSEGVVAIVAALNAAFRVVESRSWVKVRAIALSLALAISLLFLSALSIAVVGEHFLNWLGATLHVAPAMILLWKAMQWPTALAIVILAYALIYTFGPDLQEKHWHWITPGSVFGAALWLAASIAFRVYLRFVNDYTLLFGSLGALVILLVWLYVTGLAFLIGGEINANIERAAGRDEALGRGVK